MSQQQPGISVQDLIDLERYPLDQPDSPELAAVIAGALETLDDTGVCLLPGFVRDDALPLLVEESRSLTGTTHRQDHEEIAYGHYRKRLDEFPQGHAVRRTSQFHMNLVPGDVVPDDGPLRTIFHWQPLTDFIATLTRHPALYRVADPLLDCNISVLDPGDTHGWHYDGNDFTVTLMIQSAETGGRFEFYPNIANPDDENFEAVTAVFDGERKGILTPPLEAGTLNVFHGRYSIHHVTPVEGSRPRMLSIFSYHEEPGMMFPANTQKIYTGRTAA
ncbi:MAG: hypothetical protein HOL02_19410 [Rhodospirillaceae bacterium]|jgi:hypothetical protein|nr:hypothetical protein [Rhodospirillaceae bacterium]